MTEQRTSDQLEWKHRAQDEASCERFWWDPWTWDIATVKHMLEAVPHPVLRYDIREAAALLPATNLGPEDCQYADLDFPIIVGWRDGEELVIDGWHRIAKASHQGISHLPAIILTKAENDMILQPSADFDDDAFDDDDWYEDEEWLMTEPPTGDRENLVPLESERTSDQLGWQIKDSTPELFTWDDFQWDIRSIKRHLQNEAFPIEAFDIEGMVAELDDVWISWSRVENDPLNEIDLDFPIIVGWMDGMPLVIDGWHRIAKANRQGLTALPAVVLPIDDPRYLPLVDDGGWGWNDDDEEKDND